MLGPRARFKISSWVVVARLLIRISRSYVRNSKTKRSPVYEGWIGYGTD
jgi:hypothetical protein